MCVGSPSAPPPPPIVPEAPRTPDVGFSGSANRRRRALSNGENGRSTILTSARGVQDNAATTTKSLLGQ